ncbi:MAG: hemolysin family protein [Dehalococcoidia bacterium]
MDIDLIVGIILLIAGVITLVLLSAAEAGVIAGVRERALKEPAESPVEALRRFYQERQVTLSSLALARNLASVGVTGIAIFLVIGEAGQDWLALVVTVVVTAVVFMLLRGFARSLVSRNPQRWQRILRPMVACVRFVFRVPAAIVDVPIEAVMHGGRSHGGSDTPVEELLMLAEMEDASAALQDEEREMIRGVMELEFTLVREVMVPRPDIVSVEVNLSFDEVASALVERGFSRLPVYEGDIDHIVGIVHAKEVLRHLTNGNQRPTVRDIVREVHVVPESKKVHELLSEMKDLQISIAIVVDEYGGTAGLVTVEDLVEEIVGEIRDEYDVEEQPIEQLSDAEAIVDGRVGIDELNEMFEAQIQKEDFDSVGGFIVNELGRMPSVGDTVRFNGISLKVLTVAGRRIKKVLVTKAAHESED